MITHVKVEYYKHTGKFYDAYEFDTNTDVSETGKLKEEIKAAKGGHLADEMYYTFEDTQGDALNKRLVIF